MDDATHKRHLIEYVKKFTFQKCTGQIQYKMPLTNDEGRADYTLDIRKSELEM